MHHRQAERRIRHEGPGMSHGYDCHRCAEANPDRRVGMTLGRQAVADAPGDEDAGCVHRHGGDAEHLAHQARLNAVRARHDGRQPRTDGVAEARHHRQRQEVRCVEVAVLQHERDDFGQRYPLGNRIVGSLDQAAPPRRAHCQQEQRQRQARCAGHDEDELPRADFTQQRQSEGLADTGNCQDDQSADEQRDTAADRDAHVVEAEGAPELLARERVRDHRVRSRRQRRFADADPDACEEQLREISRHAAECRHQRPDDDADGDDLLAVHPVGEPADRNAEERVEDRESEALQQADLRVRDLQVAFDRLDQQRDDLAVDEREYVEDQQRYDQVPALPLRAVGIGLDARRERRLC